MFRKHWQLTLTIAFACMGLLLSMQFRTHQAMNSDLNTQSNDTLAAIARNLNTKQSRLVQEVWDLRTQLRLLEQSADQEKLALEAMKREQQKLNIAIGSTRVEGPGLIITITENDQNYFGYQDIVDIVNELWNAGAEAVSVNGFRVSHNTAFLPAEEYSSIMLKDRKLSPPYEIIVIGEPTSLEKGIAILNGIVDDLRSLYKIPVEINQVEKISIPATPMITHKYVRSIE